MAHKKIYKFYFKHLYIHIFMFQIMLNPLTCTSNHQNALKAFAEHKSGVNFSLTQAKL